MTVVVFSKPACVQCTATYRALDEKGVRYAVRDMSVDVSALEEVKRLGYLSAPVVVVGDRSWSGFRPDLINELVEQLNNEEEK